MAPKALIAAGAAAIFVVLGAVNLPKDLDSSQGLSGKAPAFTGKTADGKTVSLSSQLKSGPFYMYFMKKDCPINAKAIAFYAKMGKGYGDKAPILGVFNGDASELKTYQARHSTPFTIVLDPDQKIISAYKVDRSPWVVEVKGTGTVGRIWEGYSKDYLSELNASVASAMQVPMLKLDFSAAPGEPAYG